MSTHEKTAENHLPEKTRLDPLSTLPFEKGFHFFIKHDDYTGITATSLVEFADKLLLVPLQSVVFHFQRKDFQKWIRGTIGDELLARKIDGIRDWPTTLSEEKLREKLAELVKNRTVQLKKRT